jgi:hypothetical protein
MSSNQLSALVYQLAAVNGDLRENVRLQREVLRNQREMTAALSRLRVAALRIARAADELKEGREGSLSRFTAEQEERMGRALAEPALRLTPN